MLAQLTNRQFLLHLGLFCLLNSCLYLFMVTQHHLLPFSRFDYTYNAHRFLPDPRISGGQFQLLPALAQYDAQWYLKIAARGYSYFPGHQDVKEKSKMQNLTFAFFPLFPVVLKTINLVFNHLYFSAFLLTNLLLLLNFTSFYLFLSRFFPHRITFPTLWLFFTFPFSIFFRSYYAESLQLFLLIWFIYFLLDRRFILSSLFLGFLNLTKGTTLPLSFLFLYPLGLAYLRRRISLSLTTVSLLLAFLPYCFWLIYNYAVTGNPFYQIFIISDAWYGHVFSLPPPIHNLILIFNFFRLPFHSLHLSQLDILTAICVSLILIKSRKKLRPQLWWTSFLIWVFPLLTRDFCSFSRYQSISFPLFIYLASTLKRPFYLLLLIFFILTLFVTSIFFVNWYWVG